VRAVFVSPTLVLSAKFKNPKALVKGVNEVDPLFLKLLSSMLR
jgi:hypothetical protein